MGFVLNSVLVSVLTVYKAAPTKAFFKSPHFADVVSVGRLSSRDEGRKEPCRRAGTFRSLWAFSSLWLISGAQQVPWPGAACGTTGTLQLIVSSLFEEDLVFVVEAVTIRGDALQTDVEVLRRIWSLGVQKQGQDLSGGSKCAEVHGWHKSIYKILTKALGSAVLQDPQRSNCAQNHIAAG